MIFQTAEVVSTDRYVWLTSRLNDFGYLGLSQFKAVTDSYILRNASYIT